MKGEQQYSTNEYDAIICFFSFSVPTAYLLIFYLLRTINCIKMILFIIILISNHAECLSLGDSIQTFGWLMGYLYIYYKNKSQNTYILKNF